MATSQNPMRTRLARGLDRWLAELLPPKFYKQRDIHLLLSYVGLGDVGLPHMAELSRLPGMPSTQAISQILKRRVAWLHRHRYRCSELQELLALVDDVTIEPLTHLQTNLAKSGLLPPGFLGQALLRILELFGDEPKRYCLLDQRLSPACNEERSVYLAQSKWNYREVFELLKQGSTSAIGRIQLSDDPMEDPVWHLLRLPSLAWHTQLDEACWYVLIPELKPLKRMVTKCFHTNRAIDSRRLATVIHFALKARTRRLDVPVGVLRRYIQSADWLLRETETVRFEGSLPELSSIEAESIKYLQKHTGGATYGQFRGHMLALGFTDANITKTAFNSPLVFIPNRGRYGNRLELV